jgi:hypothetical protein
LAVQKVLTTDQRIRPVDRFGYSVYSVVVLADPRQIEIVEGLRAIARSPRANTIAHIALVSMFCEIPSVSDVEQRVRDVASRRGPIEIRFASERWQVVDDVACFCAVRTPELNGLRADLKAAIDPISATTSSVPDRDWEPRFTIWYECPPENRAAARAALEKAPPLGTGFTATSLEFVGRDGTAYDGHWLRINAFPLRG